ncbi:signal peptidase I [Dietzia cercidiphylli]|uniref:Signal peptidase I n=1 Tax=Dietzia cercidiphylli TaxID=498199 RepID=A0ABP4V334_9ACTN|nr:signal peptidase I [Dietzia cercidiphylli]MBB1048588.1 signal peptidase I [Dietzia cercidiphylli]
MTHTTLGPRHAAPTTPRSPRIGKWIGERILDLLALGGVICIIAVVAAFAFNISLIMFKTGSMSPTIPTGSLALVREIQASQAEVGDVLTIDRPGQLPVTHRVVSTAHVGGGEYSIEMKGDANDNKDPAPYQVTQARVVIYSVPELGYLVSKVSDPRVMAGMTIAMTLLVTWSFWPRKRKT